MTSAGAKAYGVVADADGTVDMAATETLRATMRAVANENALFDRGGSIDELRARCFDETGLQPPAQPVWTQAVAAE